MKLFRFCRNKTVFFNGCHNWTRMGVRVVPTIIDLKKNVWMKDVLQRSMSLNPSKHTQVANTEACPTRSELENIFKFHDSIHFTEDVEKCSKAFCTKYLKCNTHEKMMTMILLSTTYGIDHEVVEHLAYKLTQYQHTDTEFLVVERDLKKALIPKYYWLFLTLAKLEDGIKFIVDFRKDLMQVVAQVQDKTTNLQVCQLNRTLRDLLFQWFSIGILQLQRVTWDSSCLLLEKISEFEAIHPVKGWKDIRDRVGPYRRCHIFTHPAMPGYPIVVLHTALCDRIVATVQDVKDTTERLSGSKSEHYHHVKEDKSKITTAVFYSISLTQTGLSGMRLSSFMIKQVLQTIREELPNVETFSTLSPIPGFKQWFVATASSSMSSLFSNEELEILADILKTRNLSGSLIDALTAATWLNDPRFEAAIREPLLRSCAYYLYAQKRTIYVRNIVGHFHLSNGAMMWRLNWLANPRPIGLLQSFGIMINYRYYPEKMEEYRREYMSHGTVNASTDVLKLTRKAEALMQYNDNESG